MNGKGSFGTKGMAFSGGPMPYAEGRAGKRVREHVVGGGKLKTENRNRRPNAEPSGGGGGGWKAMNEKMAKNRTKRSALNGGIAAIDRGGEIGGETASGTSIFDPVLCELVYRWFCPPAGLILDPFAGGSVRGIVASRLGRNYFGIDLRPEQAAANRNQAEKIGDEAYPSTWVVGDSLDAVALAGDRQFDLVFSCPPYGDLEVYSENPLDLSTMEFDGFMAAYRGIIAASCSLLKPDRFACFVVGDYRDKAGFYRSLPGMTVTAFEDAGLRLYNDAVLVTAVGSLPVRARKQFESTRKLGKTHQNVLVFCKGDPRRATAAIGPVEFGELEETL